MWTIGELLRWGTQYFRQRGEQAPQRIIEQLLEIVLRMSRLDLYLHFDKPLLADERAQLRKLIRAYQAGTPLAYLAGSVEFYGFRLTISPAALIPRPETELLVDFARYAAPLLPASPKILDIGTGSGCIAVAIQKMLPNAQLYAIDISDAALHLARQNAAQHQCPIHFERLDILHTLPAAAPFDLIVSNPPYVTEEEFAELPQSVRAFEPRNALLAGNSGLQFYQRFAAIFPQILVPSGFFFLEISPTVAPKLPAIFTNWSTAIFEDFQHRPRVLVGSRAAADLNRLLRHIPQYYRQWLPSSNA